MPLPSVFYYTDVNNSQQKKQLIINDWRSTTTKSREAVTALLAQGFTVRGYQRKELVTITSANINEQPFSFSRKIPPKDDHVLVIDFYWMDVLTSGRDYDPENPPPAKIDLRAIMQLPPKYVTAALQSLDRALPIIVNDILGYEPEIEQEIEFKEVLKQFATVTTQYSHHAYLTTEVVKKFLAMKEKPNLQELTSLEIEGDSRNTLEKYELEEIIAITPKLQTLIISWVDFTESFNYSLLSSIQDLSIKQATICDFKQFAAHTMQVTSLSLRECSFNLDDSMDFAFPMLKNLTLTVKNPENNYQEKLKQLLRNTPNLQSLTAKAPDTITLPVGKFEHLETLALTSTAFFLDNSSFRNVSTLRLSRIEFFGSQLPSLSDKIPKLSKLTLDNCWFLNNEIPSLKNLEELDLTWSKEKLYINTNFLKNLGIIAPHLKKLSISFKEFRIWQPLQPLENLEELTLCTPPNQRRLILGSLEKDLLKLLQCMPNLQRVNLERFCHILNSPVYDYLYKKLAPNAIKITRPEGFFCSAVPNNILRGIDTPKASESHANVSTCVTNDVIEEETHDLTPQFLKL